MEKTAKTLMPSRHWALAEAASRHPMNATWADTSTPSPPMNTGAAQPSLAGRAE